MQTISPILYPLYSAEEVLFVEQSLKDFRAKAAENFAAGVSEVSSANSSSTLSLAEWNKMTKAQKLTLIEKNWSLGALRDIKPWIIQNATVCAVMDLCAASPGTWVTFKVACAKAKMEFDQGRGQMQALTKKKKLMGKATWPILVESTPPGKIGLAYQMPPSVADLWKQVRSEP